MVEEEKGGRKKRGEGRVEGAVVLLGDFLLLAPRLNHELLPPCHLGPVDPREVREPFLGSSLTAQRNPTVHLQEAF